MRLSIRTESGLGEVTVAALRTATMFVAAARVAQEAVAGTKALRMGMAEKRLAAVMRPRNMVAGRQWGWICDRGQPRGRA
mmetsp:Transcript_49124/g.137551  ORF Transcript_49124/g.137551 Transcript_49124/m.137551 type:complete len:80 (-) Transcript_49124:2-241(-)